MHPTEPVSCLVCVCVCLEFCCSQCFSVVLSSSTSMGFQNVPQVLKVFPNMFLMALHFVPYALPKGVLLQPT
jgi:hypothetical protein